MTMTRYSSVWDALENDPVRRDNLKLRSELMFRVAEHIKQLKQKEAAELLSISQPRVSDLTNGRVDKFRLDTLINMALRIGLKVSIKTTETRRSKATGGTTAVVRRKTSDGSFVSNAIRSSR